MIPALALLVAIGCVDTTAIHSKDPESAVELTTPGVVYIDVQLDPWEALGRFDWLGDPVALRETLAFDFGDSIDPDGAREPVVSIGEDAVAEARLYRGQHAVRVDDPIGRFEPGTARFSLDIDGRESVTVRLDRRAMNYVGTVRAEGQLPPGVVPQVQLRWRADRGRPCHEGRALGAAVPVSGERFSVAGKTVLGGGLCVLVQAGPWGSFSLDVELPGVESCAGSVSAEAWPAPDDEQVAELDVGELVIRRPAWSAVGLGGRSAVERLRTAPDWNDDACEVSAPPVGDTTLTGRLMMVEVALGRELDFAVGGCASGADDMPCALPVEEGRPRRSIERVGVLELPAGDEDVPTMFPVDALPHDAFGRPHLGDVGPEDCADEGNDGTLRDALEAERMGAGGRRLRLPYCVSNTRMVGLQVVLETDAGDVYRRTLDIVRQSATRPVVDVTLDPAERAGGYWIVRRSTVDVRLAVDQRAGWRLAVDTEPTLRGDLCDPPADLTRSGRQAAIGDSAIVEELAFGEASTFDPLPGQPFSICAYVQTPLGDVIGRRFDIVRAAARPQGFFRLLDPAVDAGMEAAGEQCPLGRVPEAEPGPAGRPSEACSAAETGRVGRQILLVSRLEPQFAALSPAPFVERETFVNGQSQERVAFDDRAYQIDLSHLPPSATVEIDVVAYDPFGEPHPLPYVASDGAAAEPSLRAVTNPQAPILSRLRAVRCEDCGALSGNCPDGERIGGECEWLLRCRDNCAPGAFFADDDPVRPTLVTHPRRPLLLRADRLDESAHLASCAVLSITPEALGIIGGPPGPSIERAVAIDGSATGLLTLPAGDDLCRWRNAEVVVSGRLHDRACLASDADRLYVFLDDEAPTARPSDVRCITLVPGCIDDVAQLSAALVQRCDAGPSDGDGERLPPFLGGFELQLTDEGSRRADLPLRYRVVAVPAGQAPPDAGPLACEPEGTAPPPPPECGEEWGCIEPDARRWIGLADLALYRDRSARLSSDVCRPEGRPVDVALWVHVVDAIGNTAWRPLFDEKLFRVFVDAGRATGASRDFARPDVCGEGVDGDGEPVSQPPPVDACPIEQPQ